MVDDPVAGHVRLSIVVPAQDEEDNVGPLVLEIEREVIGAGLSCEVIVVDDGSRDGTYQRLLELCREHPALRVRRHAVPLGQSAAMRTGIRAATGALVATLDADLQNDPADLPRMVALLERTGAGLVQGDRSANRRDNLVRRLGSRVGRVARRVLLGDRVRDTGCSARVMTREVAQELPLQFKGMHRFIPAYAGLLGVSVRELAVTHRPRRAGRTKYGLGIVNRGWSGLCDCFAMRWMASRMRVARAPTTPGNVGPGPESGGAPEPESAGGPRAGPCASRAVAVLGRYVVLCYVLGLANAAGYLRAADWSTGASALFTVLVYATYPGLYLVPAITLAGLLHVGVARLTRPAGQWSRTGAIAVAAAAVVGTSVTQILVFADRTIFGLFGMHVNGFVWNLVTTPGGLESMGGGARATAVYAALAGGYVAAHALLWIFAKSAVAARVAGRIFGPRRVVALALGFALSAFAAHMVYGIAALRMKRSVLVSSQAFPFFQRVSIRSAAKWLGYEEAPRQHRAIRNEATALTYPLAPLVVEPPVRPLNVVWLTVESLRADMLDPAVMPRIWALAQRSHRFRRHYSGGNGTRVGVFTQFYGLHGSYWFSFLGERRGPALIDVLLDQRYQIELFTSAHFSYPEFDKTVFSRIPQDHMHEQPDELGWKSDQINVGKVIAWLAARDRSRPFLLFEFFESPHARYYFPDESVIRRPYLEDLNYATANLERDMELIKNRYVNACHHLDAQVGRVLDALEAEGLLDSTIVLVTGDHGEEFMEKGRWGHNSHFSEEQIRVPLVLSIPGTGSSVVERMTSHVDVPATLLPLLGVKNPPTDYSVGSSMLAPTGRSFTVISSWSELGYVDDRFKMTFQLDAGNWASEATDADDRPLADPDAFFAATRDQLGELFRELVRFAAGR